MTEFKLAEAQSHQKYVTKNCNALVHLYQCNLCCTAPPNMSQHGSGKRQLAPSLQCAWTLTCAALHGNRAKQLKWVTGHVHVFYPINKHLGSVKYCCTSSTVLFIIFDKLSSVIALTQIRTLPFQFIFVGLLWRLAQINLRPFSTSL